MTTSPPTQFLSHPETGRIAYDVRGAGPLVLLVPGMGELRSTYRFLAPLLAAAGYTVVTTDLQGHGESSASFSSYGDTDTADDLTLLLRELGEPAVIIGNSMAAGAAVIVASESPELVSGLVLIGPFVREPTTGAAPKLMFRALMLRPWAAVAWNAYLPTLYSGRKPADFADYRRDVLVALKRPDYTRAFALTTRTSHVRAGESLADVSAPALVIMGEQDPDFKDPSAEAAWIAGVLSAEVTMVPDAGHYPHAQQPEATSSAILSFLAAVGTRA
jgi:pimeloyl-ACP methyl ester carboxylesterase